MRKFCQGECAQNNNCFLICLTWQETFLGENKLDSVFIRYKYRHGFAL